MWTTVRDDNNRSPGGACWFSTYRRLEIRLQTIRLVTLFNIYFPKRVALDARFFAYAARCSLAPLRSDGGPSLASSIQFDTSPTAVNQYGGGM